MATANPEVVADQAVVAADPVVANPEAEVDPVVVAGPAVANPEADDPVVVVDRVVASQVADDPVVVAGPVASPAVADPAKDGDELTAAFSPISFQTR